MNLNVVVVNELSKDAKKIREDVFMIEQGFKDEFDEIDLIAKHIVLYDEDKAIGCCRYYQDKDIYYIGRVAVVKAYRGMHLGERIIKEAENSIKEEGGILAMLHAQCVAQDFYKKQGYVSFGQIDYDEHCPHIWMKKELKEIQL